jgi:hypothetical protein
LKSTFQRHFDLDGIRLRISARVQGDQLATIIDLLLGAYAMPPVDGLVEIEIELDQRDQCPVPPASRPRFHFPPMAAWSTAGGFRFVDDVADLELTTGPDHSRLHGFIDRSATMPQLSRCAGLTLWVAIMEALRARGRYPLHGAALVGPGGRTLLLAGTKAAGKSTATLALAERGWRVVTDDTLFIERDPGGRLQLIGYKKRFHLRADLLARRPDLAAIARRPGPFEPQDKVWIDLEERLPGCTLPHCSAPDLILFPRVVDAPRSQIIPVGARAALLALMAESSFVFVRESLAPAHLAVLAELASGARAAELHAGRDLLTNPAGYLDLVHTADTIDTIDKREEPSWLSASASS